MKKIITIIALTVFTLSAQSQGNNNGKGKDKDKNVSGNVKSNNGNQDEVTNGVKQKGHAKNQPPKVKSAFYNDYPNATNVVWSKYKGDYTATFSNGIWKSTAIYHSNGERRDTRTPLTRNQLPGGTIWDKIFKRDRVEPKTFIQIERPTVAEKIYRILSNKDKVYFYDEKGNRIEYNY